MIADRYNNDTKPHLDLTEIQLKTKKKIEEKIKDGHYQFEENPCAICEQNNFLQLSEKDRYGLYCSNVICKDCGLIQLNPRMTQKSYDEFYNKEYRDLYMNYGLSKEAYFKTRYQSGQEIFNLLSKNYKKLSNPKDVFVLDIGCGIGGILKYFSDQGCTVKGIDLGSEFVNYGKEKHDLDLSVAKLENLTFDKKPDIIIYSHVFEHLLDLNSELELIKRVLNKNGILYLEVPGLKNPQSFNVKCKGDFLRYVQNAHTYSFTQQTLKNLLVNSGFQLLYGDEMVRSIFKLNEQSNEKIVNEFEPTLSYLKRAELFQKLYPLTPYNLMHIPTIIKNKLNS